LTAPTTGLLVNDEDLTGNFCTNNEQVEQFRKLLEVDKGGQR